MDLLIRKMEPHEAKKVHRYAKRSFGVPEMFFLPKPKEALVAVIDGKIVGGFAYVIEEIGDKKVAFISILYTDLQFRGLGVANKLCTEGIRYLWEHESCDVLVTYVRDDNIGSWKSFENNGFVMASLRKLMGCLSPAGVAKLYINTGYGLSIGHDFYVAIRDEKFTPQYKKDTGSLLQVIAYVLANLFLVAHVLQQTDNALHFVGAYIFVLLGSVLAGYIGTLFTKRKWNFRLPTGGLLLVPVGLVIMITGSGFIPMIGNWYPQKYENTPEFTRDMAINSLAVWLFFLAVAASNLAYTGYIVSMFLLLKCVPLPPFGSYGAERVYKWNASVFMLLAIVSILITFAL